MRTRDAVQLYKLMARIGHDAERPRVALIRFIARCGGDVTPRMVVRSGPRHARTTATAIEALNELFSEARGEWYYPPQRNGRPSLRFYLYRNDDGTVPL